MTRSADDKTNMNRSLTSASPSFQSLQHVGQTESKVAREKVVKTLELCQFLVKHVHQQVGIMESDLLMCFQSRLSF